jgi:hypothetical protein
MLSRFYPFSDIAVSLASGSLLFNRLMCAFSMRVMTLFSSAWGERKQHECSFSVMITSFAGAYKRLPAYFACSKRSDERTIHLRIVMHEAKTASPVYGLRGKECDGRIFTAS